MNASILLADAWNFLAGMSATVLVLLVFATLFWIWAIFDCAVNRKLDATEKLVWLLVIFFFHVLGAVVYVAAGRNGSGRLRTS
jgi:hypothetical protein